MKPAIPITDKRFRYTPARLTNIRVRFDLVRLQLKTQHLKLVGSK